MRTRYFFGAFALAIGLCLCTLIYVSPRIVGSTLAAFAFSAGVADGSHKIILYWNTVFGDPNFYIGEGYVARHCPRYNNCFATHSRYLLPSVDAYDALVFHGINNQLDGDDLPEKRKPEQRYVFVALESPANRHIGDDFDGYFNLTMTYRLDSDVIWSYADLVSSSNESVVVVPSRDEFQWRGGDRRDEGTVPTRDAEEEAQLTRQIRGKRKIAVWYRSNCETRSGRERYVNQLEKHLAVAKYGKCSKQVGCTKDQNCFKTDVEPNYFFYLSFENSLCEDYVTEKFFNALKYNVVPVVYGGANYSRFAPPKSYINALDFDTPKDLAKYLIKLSRNTTEYKTYFDWKKHYRLTHPTKRIICDLCEILNGNQQKTYTISKWYSTNNCPLQRQLDKQIAYGGSDYASKRTFLIQ